MVHGMRIDSKIGLNRPLIGVKCSAARSELHGLRRNHEEFLRWHFDLGRGFVRTLVWEEVNQFVLRYTWSQRIRNRVPVICLGNRSTGDRHPAGWNCLPAFDFGAFRQSKLK